MLTLLAIDTESATSENKSCNGMFVTHVQPRDNRSRLLTFIVVWLVSVYCANTRQIDLLYLDGTVGSPAKGLMGLFLLVYNLMGNN